MEHRYRLPPTKDINRQEHVAMSYRWCREICLWLPAREWLVVVPPSNGLMHGDMLATCSRMAYCDASSTGLMHGNSLAVCSRRAYYLHAWPLARKSLL
ncbi:hypothetical protein SLA2020_266220 [Shorea laevis]